MDTLRVQQSWLAGGKEQSHRENMHPIGIKEYLHLEVSSYLFSLYLMEWSLIKKTNPSDINIIHLLNEKSVCIF